ncbi:MAG: hypothetical protein M0P71_01050 [Melioribacteraceae bacterium]|nr:hypothetical protein [Melioribacteraceae bacterium]
MNPRVEYKLTDADLKELLEASRPTPVMSIGGNTFSSPQENANRAWAKLGERLRFDPMSVRPIQGKGNKFFTAIPNETKEQKEERLKFESEQNKKEKIETLKKEIKDKEEELKELTNG